MLSFYCIAPSDTTRAELITAHFSTWVQVGAAVHSHICSATADTARHFAEQEVKMIILFTCNEANAQLLTEREAMKDALNTCLRPESFLRLENAKVCAPAPCLIATRFILLQTASSMHLNNSGALRRRVDYMRDAFKPAIKRMRDGCDVARRVEVSMIASAALGHAAILEEQSNLIQVQIAFIFCHHHLHAHVAVIAKPFPLAQAHILFTFFSTDGAIARTHALRDGHSALSSWRRWCY
jgi:hypothetical protein